MKDFCFKALLLFSFLFIYGSFCSYGQNDLQLLTKPNLKVLDLGNSYTNHTTEYLKAIATKTGADVSDMCLYKAVLQNSQFKKWYKLLCGELEGDSYKISKVVGGITIDTQTGDFDVSDPTIINLISDNDWDLIIIHQQSRFAPYYDQWSGDGTGGWLNELVGRLRELQPNAALGTYLIHSYSDDYSDNIEQSSFFRWQLIASSVQQMMNDYDISFVLPYGTAIENLRSSSLNNDSELTIEGVHLASGLPRYTAACCYYETLIAPRTGISMYGNEYRPIADENTTNPIPVTEDNAPMAQEAARLALIDWFNCINPEDSKDQTIALSELPWMAYGDEDYELPEKTNEGLRLSWTSDNTDVASVKGHMLTIKGYGSANIIANQNGNKKYKPITKIFPLYVTDEAGIENITSSPGDSDYYSLNGIKSGKPKRGIYISNGKKSWSSHNR